MSPPIGMSPAFASRRTAAPDWLSTAPGGRSGRKRRGAWLSCQQRGPHAGGAAGGHLRWTWGPSRPSWRPDPCPPSGLGSGRGSADWVRSLPGSAHQQKDDKEEKCSFKWDLFLPGCWWGRWSAARLLTTGRWRTRSPPSEATRIETEITNKEQKRLIHTSETQNHSHNQLVSAAFTMGQEHDLLWISSYVCVCEGWVNTHGFWV